MRRKLYLETFGCQMNVLDSELLLNQLRAIGYVQVLTRDDADVVIYNTCSVREHAEQKVWSRLGELREKKAADPQLVIGVIGCMAEREGTSLFSRYPYLDVLCGPGELDKLPGMLQNAALSNLVAVGSKEKSEVRQVALMGRETRRSTTLAAAEDTLEMLDLSRSFSPADGNRQAYVRITRGCNKFCSYCVVPYTRGSEVHRPPQNIIEEVKQLAAGGYVEVTLLGQTVNHYNYKHPDGHTTTFADLLYQVHEATPNLPRLRFVTSFPRDFSDEALQAMRDCPRICRYLHIPAQSGSDRILRLMNRGYTSADYMNLIDRARAMMPDISLASDFIVGFPSETDAEFQETMELAKYCRFKNSFIFKYSPRPRTQASERYPDDVSSEVKRQRNTDLLALQSGISAANIMAMVGQTLDIMVEGEGSLTASAPALTPGAVQLGWQKPPARVAGHKQLIGRTRGDHIVAFDADPAVIGQIASVTITAARHMTLFGKLS